MYMQEETAALFLRYKNSRHPEQRGSNPQAKAPPTRDTFAMNIKYVWRISQDFDVSARILAYHQGALPTFGISETTMGSVAV